MSKLAALDGFKGPMYEFWRTCSDVEFLRHLERTFGQGVCGDSLSFAVLSASVKVVRGCPELSLRSAFTPLVVSVVDEVTQLRCAALGSVRR